MVNIPVTDRFALRAQAAYLNEEGYVRRGSQLLGGSEDWLGRIQASYEFTDTVKLTLGGLYSDSKSDGSPQDLETFDRAALDGISADVEKQARSWSVACKIVWRFLKNPGAY